MYKPVIGLEIHVELKTKSKMFCQCLADYFGKEPNTNTCPVCLGLPGALPVPNQKAIEWCILIGKAFNCTIPEISKFDRKHYFYPDLPKGYQISQYDEPIAINGLVNLVDSVTHEQLFPLRGSAIKPQSASRGNPPHFVTPTKFSRYRIHRVHIEEDTGKLIHSGSDTLVDFNRSGVPLVEIVTEPDFDNAEDVKKFLEELHTIIRYLGVSDADMEKGSMRLEPNISLQKIGKKDLPNYKVEIKNINSFRFVKQAIEYEIERQREILESGKTPEQETRGFDEKKGITYSQRSKEEAQDYRYFPEPDIPPMKFSKEYIESIKVPELPAEKLKRFIENFGVKKQDAFILTRDLKKALEFERHVKHFEKQHAQRIANIMINTKIDMSDVKKLSEQIREIITPKQYDNELLETTINKIIETNKKVVEDYKRGKQNALMFLVGQVMRELKGKADARLIIEKLKSKLKS